MSMLRSASPACTTSVSPDDDETETSSGAAQARQIERLHAVQWQCVDIDQSSWGGRETPVSCSASVHRRAATALSWALRGSEVGFVGPTIAQRGP